MCSLKGVYGGVGIVKNKKNSHIESVYLQECVEYE